MYTFQCSLQGKRSKSIALFEIIDAFKRPEKVFGLIHPLLN